MNPICKFCMNGSGEKCINRHKKLSNFGEKRTTRKQGQQTTTVKSTIEPTTAVVCNDDFSYPNRLIKTKSTKKQLEQDLIALRNENAKLSGTIVTLGTSTSMLTEELREEKNKNAKLTEELNVGLLENDDHQCCICLQIFIKPSLLGCSHMFCEWCIDKWLEKYNHCPTCRVRVDGYVHCLNMNNFIQRKMELMPAEIRLPFKELEEARAKEKETSMQIQADRRRLEIITIRLNGNRPIEY
eukprot:XP_016661363.1 PREDICTED: E3 ubiquitin-protein ligase RNF8-like [Acyrthosiphon pisum]